MSAIAVSNSWLAAVSSIAAVMSAMSSRF